MYDVEEVVTSSGWRDSLMKKHKSQLISMEKHTVGDRLREERERLHMSQAIFAVHGGVKPLTQHSYEKGSSYPNAEYLAKVAQFGVDVLYVITGQRKPVPQHVITAIEDDQSLVSGRKVLLLNEREQALLQSYMAADEVGKHFIEGTADLATKSAAKKKGNSVVIDGDVGQSIAGDQNNTGRVSFSVGKRK